MLGRVNRAGGIAAMTDFRALCAELLEWAERTSSHYYIQADVVLRARAVLAQWGRPTPQPPADGEAAELVQWLRRGSLLGNGDFPESEAKLARAAELLQQQVVKIQDLEQQLETERMRVVACGIIATSDTPFSAAKNRDCHPDYWSASADDIARQIDELMRLRAQQKTVPVSERLPGPEDCDEQRRCWWFTPKEGNTEPFRCADWSFYAGWRSLRYDRHQA